MLLSSGISPADKPSIAAIPKASYSDALANTELRDIARRSSSSFGRTMSSTAWLASASSARLRISVSHRFRFGAGNHQFPSRIALAKRRDECDQSIKPLV